MLVSEGRAEGGAEGGAEGEAKGERCRDSERLRCGTVATPPLDPHGSQTMVAVVTGTEAWLPAGPPLGGEGSLLNQNLCVGGAGGGVPPSDLIHELHLFN